MSKGLIWDFDGTLGYREGGMFSGSICQVIRQAAPGTSVTEEQVRPYLQTGFPWHTPERPHPEIRSADQWWERLYPVFERALLGLGFDPPQAASMARQVRPVYTDLSCWRLFDDAIPALTLLSSQGWRHVILSNHVPELPEIVRHLGLDPHIDRLFNSAEMGYEKPHPAAFEVVLAHLSGSVVCMVGDNVRADVEGARSLGIPAILVRTDRREVEHYCDDLAQLPGTLERVLG